jgi:hypothetical protein
MNRTNEEDTRNCFLKLLDEKHGEQVYQEFLEQNTEFIPRDFVQNHGIHFSLVLRKLSFGADYKSDFFFFSKSSDDWNAVFVEIEKPQSRYFADKGNKLHQDFQAAVGQIKQWKAWLSVPNNKSAFLQSLASFQVPSYMAMNPTNCKFVLVHGRRNEYSGNADRRRLIQSYEEDDFKIMSFDSLAENLVSKHKLMIGVRHNSFIDVLGDEVVSGSMFGWMEPTQLRVSAKFLEILKNGSKGPKEYVMVNGKPADAWQEASKTILVR